MTARDPGGRDDATADEMTPLLDRAHALLHEIYKPAGVLIFWSSRVTYLDGKRPCDLVHDRDLDRLRRLCDRLDALADGAFS